MGEEAVGWDRHPEGAIDERLSVPTSFDRRMHFRWRYDRDGRLVDYAIVLTGRHGDELIRADMAHGTPEIHHRGGVARPTGDPIRTFGDVRRAFDRDSGVVAEYADRIC